MLARMACEPLEMGIVAIDDRRAARLQPTEDLRLGVGDLLDGAEEAEMHRRHRGDDGDMRAAPAASATSISPAWFMPISNTPKPIARGMLASVSGTPQ